MKAMIFAAGLGTRLRPLTNDRPKALVEVDGRTLLEILLGRLRDCGIREVVINAHHFADQLVEYLKAHDHFGLRVAVSREDVLLDTGGGLKKAAPFFLGDAQSVAADEPILVHNVDVLSTIDLARMAEVHRANKALTTLAVQERKTSRYLLFDEHGQLCGRRIGEVATAEVVRRSRHVQPLAFAGIHVISPRLFAKLTEDGPFSIITSYLRLAAGGESILAFRADESYWRDLGRLEDLECAARDLRESPLDKH
ncbi:MAG: nucleotidyltransferase family protein [Terriglobales bacterium]